MVRAFPVVVLNSGLPGCAGWEGDIGGDAPDEQAATVINTVPAATCHLRRPMIRGYRAVDRCRKADPPAIRSVGDKVSSV